MSRYFPQAMPFIWSRVSWGARPPTGKLSPLSQPRRIVLHHTVSAPAAPSREIRTIQDYHLQKGFADIGYHFLLDRPSYVNGQDVYWGRETGADGSLNVGAHSRGHNQDSIGVAVLGDYESEQPSREQLRSLAVLLAWLCFAWDIDPDAIVPHSALNPTSCPGRFLTAALPWLRWQVTWRLHGLDGEAPFQPPEGDPDTVRIVVGNGASTLRGWLRDGTLWAPVRALATALGRRVEWDDATRTAYVFLQRRPILALPPPPPPRVRVVVEGSELAADPPPMVKDNMSVAPLPALAGALGQVVLFDAPSRTAAVVTPCSITKTGGGAGSCTRVRR